VFLLIPAYLGSPGPKAVKRLCVCVRVCMLVKKNVKKKCEVLSKPHGPTVWR